MYHVFVNNKPIVLTTIVEKEAGFKNYLLDTVNIGKVIRELTTTSLKEARLLIRILKDFLKNF